MIGRGLKIAFYEIIGLIIWTTGHWLFQKLTDTGAIVQVLQQLPTDTYDYDEYEQTTSTLRKFVGTGANPSAFFDLLRESRFECIGSVRQTTNHTVLCRRWGGFYSLTCWRRWTVEVHYEWEVGRRSETREVIGQTSKECS